MGESNYILWGVKELFYVRYEAGIDINVIKGKTNPYRRMAQAKNEHTVMSNILNRKFDTVGPWQALFTDITYVYYGIKR